MIKKYTVRYTPPAVQCLEDIDDSLSHRLGENEALLKMKALAKFIRLKLSDTPYKYRACEEAVDLGFDRYRQLIFDGYRVIYEVQEAESPIVAIHLVLGQRQSITAQLVRYCLVRG